MQIIQRVIQLEVPHFCGIDECKGIARVAIRADGMSYAVCPECIVAIMGMNSDNARFFAQHFLGKFCEAVGAYARLVTPHAEFCLCDQCEWDHYAMTGEWS